MAVVIYTQEEIDLILRLRDEEGLIWSDIAIILGRQNTGAAVRAKYIKEKADYVPRNVKQKIRFCLRCQTEFESEGPHNRMCVGCRAVESSPMEPDLCAGSSSRQAGRAALRIRSEPRNDLDSLTATIPWTTLRP